MPDGGDEQRSLRDEVVACAERTLAVPRARIELTREWDFAWPDEARRSRRSGGLLRPLGGLAKTAGKAAAAAAWRHWTEQDDPRRISAEGVMEPPMRRYMLDFGSYAEIYKDGRRWGGPAGRPITPAGPSRRERRVGVWWLLDVLRGTTDATLEGEEALHGTSCRRVAVRADLARASAAAPGGMHVPTVERFEELSALPVTAWIDAEHVRRVRFTEADVASTTVTLDVVELQSASDELDWDRLPELRSP